MRSPSANEMALRGAQRLDDRMTGLPPTLFHTVASRMASQRIADSTALPVLPSTLSAQDANGNFWFTFGYSLLGGGDLLR